MRGVEANATTRTENAARWGGGVGVFPWKAGSETEALVFLLELRHAAALVHQARAAAGPGGVHRRIDVERERVALRAPGGAHLNHVAIGHLDVDDVVIGMDILFHLEGSLTLRRRIWDRILACRWCPRRSGRTCRGVRAGNRASRGARGRDGRPRSSRYSWNGAGRHAPRLRRTRSFAP